MRPQPGADPEAVNGDSPQAPQDEKPERLEPHGAAARPAGLKKRLLWHHLVGLTFFAVCGGDYGMEESVGAAGPTLSLLGIILLPWFWSLPIALMTAELGAMIPEAGGYVVWIHRAFGFRWAHLNATWNLVSNTFDNALCAAAAPAACYCLPPVPSCALGAAGTR